MPTGIYIRKPLSEEALRKIRKRMMGNKRALGFIQSEETIKKKIKNIIGKKNKNWKGAKVGYGALHTWVRRKLGKAKKCSICGKEGKGKEMNWANIDHKYRRNVKDFMEICSTCHGEYDKDNNLRKRK